MEKKETVYAFNQQGYYQTTRDTNHPSLVLSRANSLKLPYTVCNQVYKGPSKFLSVQAQLKYNQFQRKQFKHDLSKSQLTQDTSQINQHLSNSMLSDKASIPDENKTAPYKKSLFHSHVVQSKPRPNYQQHKQFQLSFQQDVVQVHSENTIEEDELKDKQQVSKLKQALSYKDKEIEQLKQMVNQYRLKQQNSLNKLQLIKLIASHDQKQASPAQVSVYQNINNLLKSITKHA